MDRGGVHECGLSEESYATITQRSPRPIDNETAFYLYSLPVLTDVNITVWHILAPTDTFAGRSS